MFGESSSVHLHYAGHTEESPPTPHAEDAAFAASWSPQVLPRRRYVILGGGASGTAAASELLRLFRIFPEESRGDIVLISSSETVELVVMPLENEIGEWKNREPIETCIEEARNWISDMVEEDCEGTISVIVGIVQSGIDPEKKTVAVSNVQKIVSSSSLPSWCNNSENNVVTLSYDCLLLAVGASPESPLPQNWDAVYTVRDTRSVDRLADLIAAPDETDHLHARRRVIVLLGNGGIALEVAHIIMSLKSEGDIKDADRNGIDLIWLVRDDYVGHAMLDAAAAAMLVGSGLLSEGNGEENTSKISFEDKNDRRHVGEAHSVTTDSNTILSFDGCPEGHSLGPNWKERLQRHMCTRKENVGRDIGQQHLPPFKRKRGGGGCSCCSISPGAFVLPDNGSNQIEKRKLSKKKFMSPSSDVHLDIRYSVSLAAALRQGDDSWIYLNSDAAAHLQSKAAVSDAKAFNPTEKYELCLLLSDGTILHADALISATGTNSQNNIDRLFKKNFIPQLARAPEGAVAVNKYMQCILNPPSVIDSNTNSCPSSSPFFSIYAAGDCADPTAAMLASFSSPSEPLQWHRMKLWTQAQSAGKYAARCMAGQRIAEELGGASGCGFETFVHVTNFVGKRVVLLGRYNGQGMEFIEKMPVMAGTVPFPEGGGLVSRGSMEWGKVVQGRKNRKVGNSKNNMSQYNADVSKRKEDMEPSKSYIADVHLKKKIEILARFTEGEEYIKVVVVEGKIIGAMIVGDSNLAETIENLMMSGTDISELGFDLLDPDVDVEDFFD